MPKHSTYKVKRLSSLLHCFRRRDIWMCVCVCMWTTLLHGHPDTDSNCSRLYLHFFKNGWKVLSSVVYFRLQNPPGFDVFIISIFSQHADTLNYYSNTNPVINLYLVRLMRDQLQFIFQEDKSCSWPVTILARGGRKPEDASSQSSWESASWANEVWSTMALTGRGRLGESSRYNISASISHVLCQLLF